MPKVLAAILSLAFCWSASFNSLVYWQYKQHQAYYAAELCEQKEIANNSCQGFCQVEAILKGENPFSPQSPVPPDYREESIDVFAWEEEHLTGLFSILDEATPSFEAQNNVSRGFLKANWKPPRA